MIKNKLTGITDNMPTFSIVVPVYNSERFLHKCIDSLLDQSYPDFELVLVDDGSTDSSGRICDEYAGKDLRIKVIHTVNQGVSVARNLGLSVARGKYVNFVDSDDWVSPRYLIQYVNARKDYDYDLVYAEMVRVSEEGEENVIPLKELSAKKTGDLSEPLAYLLDCGEFGFTCNKSFKKYIIQSNEISFCKDFRMFEDAIFTSVYCLHIDSIKLISSAIYFYRSVVTSLVRSGMDYETYHQATHTGCRNLAMLAKKYPSDSLRETVGLFCQRWEQWAILMMYLPGQNVSRSDRLNALKKFQYRYLLPRLNAATEKGLYKLAVIGMCLKNDRIVDLYFQLIGFLYKLKKKL
ncbi:glycosyltransferase [Parabacteroides sp. TM07-1AC]|jgi:glycosyltransferase involved in cell wall biosynthesis|uniref:glycosyltransferase family 2 protein n=1 Tax=Parabacteroides sp. TM07-1AC TaxID=2292363 RepID=UPI001F192285|nr:glycosyltransferase [Parabacteroides sp. TM07-1AC]